MPSKTIGDFTFELNQLPGWSSFEYFLRLSQALGPGIMPLYKMATGIKKGEPINVELVIGSLIASGGSTNIETLMPILRVLVKDAIVKTPNKLQPLEPVFDELLRGQIMVIFKLLVWAIEVNFLPFLLDMKNAFAGLAPGLATSQTSAPSNSSGGLPHA